MSEFYTRLLQACSENPDIPEYGKGRQTYISQQMGVSQEAVRKWFTGESKPKSAIGRKLAALLGVDYVWLTLGTSHGEIEKRREAAGRQDAAVYALMSFLIEKGYSAAFDNENDNIDIVTIYQGQQNHIAVRQADGKKENLTAAFSMSIINDVSTIIAVRTNTFSLSYDFLSPNQRVLCSENERRPAARYRVSLPFGKSVCCLPPRLCRRPKPSQCRW